MRILLVSNLFPPYVVGGYEQMAGWVAEGLRARGHAVQVLTGRGALFAGRPEITPTLDLDLAAVCDAHFGDGIAFGGNLAASVRRHVFSLRNLGAARRALVGIPASISCRSGTRRSSPSRPSSRRGGKAFPRSCTSATPW